MKTGFFLLGPFNGDPSDSDQCALDSIVEKTINGVRRQAAHRRIVEYIVPDTMRLNRVMNIGFGGFYLRWQHLPAAEQLRPTRFQKKDIHRFPKRHVWKLKRDNPGGYSTPIPPAPQKVGLEDKVRDGKQAKFLADYFKRLHPSNRVVMVSKQVWPPFLEKCTEDTNLPCHRQMTQG